MKLTKKQLEELAARLERGTIVPAERDAVDRLVANHLRELATNRELTET